MWGEVAKRLAAVLNDDTFRSLEGKSKHQLWLELCDTVTRHPREVEGSGVDVEGVIRGGIRRFTDEVSHRAHFGRENGLAASGSHCLYKRPKCFLLLGGLTTTPLLSTFTGRAAVDVAGRLLHPARHV